MSPVPRLIVSWLIVVAAAAAVLNALDHVPTLLAGTPRGVRAYASIDDAERAVEADLWMPSYYPDELAWPPTRVDVAPGSPPALVVHIAGRADNHERLVIVETLSSQPRPTAGWLAPGQLMGTNRVIVAGRAAILSRVLVETREWHDLAWEQAGRRITLRYAGPVDRLMLIAGSLARRVDETAGRNR